MQENNKSFEELLAELDQAVTQLEGKDLSLEEAIKTYQKGMDISQQCKKLLEEAKSVIVTPVENK